MLVVETQPNIIISIIIIIIIIIIYLFKFFTGWSERELVARILKNQLSTAA
jgi:hypothetical protein